MSQSPSTCRLLVFGRDKSVPFRRLPGPFLYLTWGKIAQVFFEKDRGIINYLESRGVQVRSFANADDLGRAHDEFCQKNHTDGRHGALPNRHEPWPLHKIFARMCEGIVYDNDPQGFIDLWENVPPSPEAPPSYATDPPASEHPSLDLDDSSRPSDVDFDAPTPCRTGPSRDRLAQRSQRIRTAHYRLHRQATSSEDDMETCVQPSSTVPSLAPLSPFTDIQQRSPPSPFGEMNVTPPPAAAPEHHASDFYLSSNANDGPFWLVRLEPSRSFMFHDQRSANNIFAQWHQAGRDGDRLKTTGVVDPPDRILRDNTIRNPFYGVRGGRNHGVFKDAERAQAFFLLECEEWNNTSMIICNNYNQAIHWATDRPPL
ncbi:hypothetical protein PC9H_001692 [Pleurotus ostreatus]|uniref:Uncharacterized protein n=1 Tax=Pleurotus ostreatus TaxID=5322 RepID=A0A8H7A3K6_PLEOS|nr:uncharacterized protein PC9H_001692 [Pleurotus ostreatus]KAF7441343.1 hypothetical protein PC9H_001692 [Pleurotus ostreatus]